MHDRNLLATACVVTAALTLPAASASDVIDWNDLRAGLRQSVCVDIREFGGNRAFSFVFGQPERCPGEHVGEPGASIVEDLLDASGSALATLGAADVGFRFDQSLSDEENTEAFRDAAMGTTAFLQPLLRRLDGVLAERGVTCRDCPAATQPLEMREVTIDELRPYVAAYFWPDPVRPEVDAQGQATGERHESFHVCVGMNGIHMLDDPDPTLVRAGFTVVRGSASFMARAKQHLEGFLEEEAYRDLGSAQARTEYLRRRAREAMLSDSLTTELICRRLQEFGLDLGIRVTDCAGGGADGARVADE